MKLSELRNLMYALGKHAAPVMVVRDAEQAAQMTRDDPVGHVWSIGESFYSAPIEKESPMIDPTKTSPEKLAEMNDSLIVDNNYLRAELTKAQAEIARLIKEAEDACNPM